MAQYNTYTREIDTDTDSDSNSSRSGNLHFLRSDSFLGRNRHRSTSHHLLMDAIEGSEEEKVPLPDYERLSQSMRLPGDDEVEVEVETEKTFTHSHSHSPSHSHAPKPIARKLIDKVFKKDGEKEKEKDKEGDGEGHSPAHKEKKKRSSWLPDPEKRWPVQGWS